MNDLSRLDARSFHSRLGELLRVELVALGAFLRALAEFDERRLFRDLGYASFFEYLHRGLGLSRGAAHYRRAGAFLVRRFPEVLAPIEDGRLCFSTVAVVASVLTEENRAEVLPRFYGLSKQEALELAAEIKPRALVPQRTVVTQVESVESAERAGLAAPVPVSESRRGITEEIGRIVHPGELASVPSTVAAATTVVPMTATASRLHVTVSREFLALLEKAKSGESHRNPNATDEQILKLALEALIEKQVKRKASVPARVKRAVLARDEGKCQWKLPDGGICGETVRLEIDHVIPRGKGGPSTTDNCRVTCRAHNLEAARQAYGDDRMDLFTRSPHGPVAREGVAEYAAPGDPRRAGLRSRPGSPRICPTTSGKAVALNGRPSTRRSCRRGPASGRRSHVPARPGAT